ncbi:hypothetical protein SAMN05519103_03179 [Rhizobiales bacterium GAS113]|nr:hypothetical protein SAMN05519103_03179 [Rhizobiales bacterium GAS113]
MLTFATLGPKGTNHELVTEEYIKFHGIDNATIALVQDFKQATDGLLRGDYDFVVQCAVHPDTPQTMGAKFSEIFAVDSFISRSKDLAILTRKEVEHPESIGLLAPATESYVDIGKWRTKCSGPSLPIIFEGLLKGEYDSALVYLEYADQYPDRVRVDEIIGSPDDVWIVYGLERTSHGAIQAWRDAPISGIIERKLASKRTIDSLGARP